MQHRVLQKMFCKSPIRRLQGNICNVGVLSTNLWGTRNVNTEEKYIFFTDLDEKKHSSLFPLPFCFRKLYAEYPYFIRREKKKPELEDISFQRS